LEGQYYIGSPFAFELALYDGDAKVSTELLYEPRLHQLAKGECSGLAKQFETEEQGYAETHVHARARVRMCLLTTSL
jgi:hypothetical protein